MLKAVFLKLSVFLLLATTTTLADTTGCDHLIVTVINTTNYTFVPASPSPDLSHGTVVDDQNDNPTSLENISPAPITTGPTTSSTTTIYLKGTEVEVPDAEPPQADSIKGTLSYYPQLNGQTFKSTLVSIDVEKTSCNLSLASCNMHCKCAYGVDHYDCGDWHCGEGAGGNHYRWDTEFYCGSVPSLEYQLNKTDELPSISSMQQNGDNKDQLFYTGNTIQHNPALICDQNHATCQNCNKSKYDTHASGCQITFNSGNNLAATTTFTIYPTVLTQLIITFPFNNQSETARTMIHAVYNNLNPKLLNQLTTFRVLPVALDTQSTQSTTMTFSGICTQPECADQCTDGECPSP